MVGSRVKTDDSRRIDSMRRKRDGFFFFVSLIFAFMFICELLYTGSFAHGDENKDLPLRNISVFLDSTGIVVYRGDDISIDMTVDNRGRQDENIDLRNASREESKSNGDQKYSQHSGKGHAQTESPHGSAQPLYKKITHLRPLKRAAQGNKFKASPQYADELNMKVGRKKDADGDHVIKLAEH